jgi:hypothetical protein
MAILCWAAKNSLRGTVLIFTATVVVQGVDCTPSVVEHGVDIYSNYCCAGCRFLPQLLVFRVLIFTVIAVVQGVDFYRNCCCPEC